MATRIAVIPLSDATGATLLDLLRRGRFDPCLLPAEDAASLLDLAVEAALVEFSATGRHLLDTLLSERAIVERLPLLAVLAAEELAAYEAGAVADDLVLTPARPEEVATRLRLALRRRRGDEGEDVLRFGDLAIDLANYRVSVGGQNIALTFKEYELLRFLATNRDKVFTREALLNRVWGYDYYGGARTVDVHIRRLRAKIEDGHRTYIETIRNVGYRFLEDGG